MTKEKDESILWRNSDLFTHAKESEFMIKSSESKARSILNACLNGGVLFVELTREYPAGFPFVVEIRPHRIGASSYLDRGLRAIEESHVEKADGLLKRHLDRRTYCALMSGRGIIRTRALSAVAAA